MASRSTPLAVSILIAVASITASVPSHADESGFAASEYFGAGQSPTAPDDAKASPTPLAQETVPPPTVQRVDAVDTEKEQLAALTQELQYLRQQVATASAKAPTGARVQFRYDWLARDLEMIQRGIQDHLDAPRQPRPVVPLKGAYRR